MKIIYSSDRKFILFSYDASHGLLLLRSGKTNTAQTRIDILFHDVRSMELRGSTDGLTIVQEQPEYLARFASTPLALVEDGLVAYRVGNDVWSGYVLGGVVRTAEDDREFFEPSVFLAARAAGSGESGHR